MQVSEGVKDSERDEKDDTSTLPNRCRWSSG